MRGKGHGKGRGWEVGVEYFDAGDDPLNETPKARDKRIKSMEDALRRLLKRLGIDDPKDIDRATGEFLRKLNEAEARTGKPLGGYTTGVVFADDIFGSRLCGAIILPKKYTLVQWWHEWGHFLLWWGVWFRHGGRDVKVRDVPTVVSEAEAAGQKYDDDTEHGTKPPYWLQQWW